MKILMAVLSLVGITGMYLRQVKQTGVLGLLGYLVFGAGYLLLMSIQIIGVFVLPFLAGSAPDYVNDVLVAAIGGTPPGDIGALQILFKVSGASPSSPAASSSASRSSAPASWPVGLRRFSQLALSRPSRLPLLPQVNPATVRDSDRHRHGRTRIFIVAQAAHRSAARPVPSSVGAPLDPAGAK